MINKWGAGEIFFTPINSQDVCRKQNNLLIYERPKLFITDSKFFIGDPRFFISDPSFTSDTPDFHCKLQVSHRRPQIFIGNYKFLIGDPRFLL